MKAHGYTRVIWEAKILVGMILNDADDWRNGKRDQAFPLSPSPVLGSCTTLEGQQRQSRISPGCLLLGKTVSCMMSLTAWPPRFILLLELRFAL